MTDKKYSVFVSSTYKDLREARQRVMFALLETNCCIPAGMELFPAADESQWETIQRVIDECDYYLLILGGRYGSIAPNSGGKSYTEKEYRYALGRGIPILPFLHESPESLIQGEGERKGEAEKRGKFREFRAFLQDKGTPGYWNTPDELGRKVATTLAPLLAKSDRPGWVRGDSTPTGGDPGQAVRAKAVARLIPGGNGKPLDWMDGTFAIPLESESAGPLKTLPNGAKMLSGVDALMRALSPEEARKAGLPVDKAKGGVLDAVVMLSPEEAAELERTL